MADFHDGELSVETEDGWREIGEVNGLQVGIDLAGDQPDYSVYGAAFLQVVEAARSIAEAAKPVIMRLTKTFIEASRMIGFALNGDADGLKRILKKSRNRERYYRQYARRGERMKKK